TVDEPAAEVLQRHDTTIVGVEVVPDAPAPFHVDARAASRGAIVEVQPVDVVPTAGGPVAGEDRVRVDVAAAVQPVPVRVPAGVLVEIDHAAAKPPIRMVAAELYPVADVARVGAAQEPDVVDVEAWRLEPDVRVEVHVLTADLADRDHCRVA